MKLTKQDSKVISKRLWGKEEDQLLLAIVNKYQVPKWSSISIEFNREVQRIPGNEQTKRTNKQCRQRWQNHLNPSLKNHLPWSQEQHRVLFKLFREHSHQWCVLASKLQDLGFQKRSDNNIKNYFYSSLKRQLKSINSIIRENNKQIKKKKSVIHQYSQKYHYKQRLSLERQILNNRKDKVARGEEQSSKNMQALNSNQGHHAPTSSQMCIESSQNPDLHIIKQLDQELISKILLIAQEKAQKKYVISNNHNQDYQQQALKLRDQLIELIMNKEQPLDKGQVLNLAKQMLNISRRCKKKTNKTVPINSELNTRESENKCDNMIPQVQDKAADLGKVAEKEVKKQNEGEFNERATLDKFMQEDKNRPSYTNQLQRSSMDFNIQREQPCNPYNLSFFPSYDYSRNLMERSSQLFGSGCFIPNPAFNSNMFGYFDPMPRKTSFLSDDKGQDIKKDSFINQIRQIKPSPVQNTQLSQFAPLQNNPFGFQPFHHQHPSNTEVNNQLTNSWSYPQAKSPQQIKYHSPNGSNNSGQKMVSRKNSDLSKSWLYQDTPRIEHKANYQEQTPRMEHRANSNSMNLQNPADEWAFKIPTRYENK